MIGIWLWLLLGAAPGEATLAGDEAYKRGDVVKALQAWGTALEAARSGGDQAVEFELMLRMAAAHRSLGKVETAARALELLEDKAKTPEQQAHLQLDQASTSLAAGDLATAEKTYAKAFKALRDIKEPVGAASAALNLGMVRRVRGDVQGATKAFTAAKTLFEALGDKGGQAALELEQARLARSQGNLLECQQLAQDASVKALQAGELALYVDALLVRGSAFAALGRGSAALSQYNTGLDMAAQRKDVMAQARLHNAIAGILLARGDATARQHLELAEKAFRKAGRTRSALRVALNRAVLEGGREGLQRILPEAEASGDEELLAMVLLNLATLGDTDALKRAGKLLTRSEHADLRWRYRYLAAQERFKTDPMDARGIQLLSEAVGDLERRRHQAGDDDASSRAFLVEHSDVYQALVDAYLRIGDETAAFVWAQQLATLDLPVDIDPSLAALTATESELTEMLEGARDVEQRRELNKQLAQLRVDFARRVDELRASADDFESRTAIRPEDLESVQGKLAPGVTVLQPVLLTDGLVLMVLRHDHLQVVRVDAPVPELRKTIRSLSRSLQAGHVTDPAWTRAKADQLGKWLLKPIDELLAGTEVLVTALTGDLREVPFAMLRLNEQFVVERMAVAGITNIASLARDAEPLELVDTQVLLVGNPDGSLPGAEKEVAELSKRIQGATVLLGDQGTHAAVTRAMEGKRIVHLATHGRIDRRQPSQSHLALAGPGDDGKLVYGEIPGLAYALDHCRMVVLSACQSGAAVEARDRGDGGIVVSINGLAAQFRRAGVETLVASLWAVDDDATRALMTAFYTEIAGGANPAEALRLAQLRLVQDDEHAHPWYWAGFVVVGDWR